MSAPGVYLGTYFRTPVKVHPTFWILPLLLALPNILSGDLYGAMVVATVIVIVFFVVTLHEFGHILMSQRLGYQTGEVILSPFGGAAMIHNLDSRPRDEILISLAGPAVNFALAALSYLGMSSSSEEGSAFHLFELFYHINIALGVFNLLPALPMDGGRVVRAVLQVFYEKDTATIRACILSWIVSGIVLLYGILTGNFVLAALMVFVAFLCMGEFSMALQNKRLKAAVK